MNVVLDASAVLAFLQGEVGADRVETALDDGAVIGAVNWSEVAQKVRARGGDWSLSRALLDSYGLVIEPFTRADGDRAAALWRHRDGLSIADRCCLALGSRLGVEVLTADAAWGTGQGVTQIR